MRWLRRLLGPSPAAAAAAFRADAHRHRAEFLEAARRTGRPRGLAWAAADPAGDPVFARDSAGGLVAVVPLTVRFEPTPGSDLEDVPQAREPRPVTALFTFERGRWRTVGRAVFNLSLRRVVEQGGFEPV